VAVSPDGALVLTIDVDGHAIVLNLARKTIVHRFSFRGAVRDAQFSPDGRYLAVTNAHKMEVWRSPTLELVFSPFVLHRTYTGHFADVTSVDWSPDSAYLLTCSKDATARLYTLHPMPGFIPVTLSGHRDHLVAGFFGASDALYTVSRDGGVSVWVWAPQGSEARRVVGPTRGGSPLEATAAALEAEEEDVAARVKARHSIAMLASRIAHDVPVPVRDPLTGVVSLVKGQWVLQGAHYIRQEGSRVKSAAFHRGTGLLVVGWDSGAFGLYSMPDGTVLHTLSVSAHEVHSVAISPRGDWLALGSRTLGQLLVWDWQAESYVLRQQGHAYAVTTAAHSPNGQLVATGGGDGKVKVWNAASGFCFVTFAEHTAGVTGITFIGGKGGHGLAVLSSSLDGTVRAFDLVRYRNFRTLTAPGTGTSVQFMCVAADEAGEVIAAGGMDPFNVYIWALATGQCTDVLAGHSSPISGLAFNAATALLASSSWDKTVRLWDVYRSGDATEVLTHGSDVLAVAFRPDGGELAVAALDGTIALWDVKRGVQTGAIDGRRDVAPGRKAGDARPAAAQIGAQHFTSVAYSPDGELLLAGGRSKFVSLYAPGPRLLLRRFALSHNRSLAGVLEKLRSDGVGESGTPLALLDLDSTEEDARRVPDESLPGVKKGDAVSRRHAPPEMRVSCVCWSPSASSFAAATPGGLLIFSRDEELVFDPFELGEGVTADAVHAALGAGQYARGLLLACHLGEAGLIEAALEATPTDLSRLVARALPVAFVDRVLGAVAALLHPSSARATPHVEFYLRWLLALLSGHSAAFTARPALFASSLRSAHRALLSRRETLVALAEGNRHLLDYLATGAELGV